MTDKQIIIDGVDVSGCRGYYFSPTNFHSCQDIQQVNNLGYEQDTLCENNPNCYYKQLKRKEHECEELKKIINEAKNSKLDLKSFLVGEAVQREYEQQLNQLKAENEKLKQYKSFTNVYDLKDHVLKRCIHEVDNIKQQILELFGVDND